MTVRGALTGLLAAALMAAPAAAAEKDVAIFGGLAPLEGALLVPDRVASGAAVLMLEGSGNVDRNGNTPTPEVRSGTNRLIAEGLAARGIISLRIDKRCIGASRAACPGEEKLRLGDFVDDAVMWVQFLRGQPGVRCVAIYGHSEGALIAALAAAKVETCGVVSASGIGRPFDVVLREQLRASGAPPQVLERVDAIQAELRQGRTVAKVPYQLANLFRPSVQPYLISEFQVDPAKALAAVKAPVLILQGDRDIQVSVEDARLLAAARPGAKLVLVPGANHMFKPAPADRAGNLATYADPALPLSPGVVPAIADFVAGLGSR